MKKILLGMALALAVVPVAQGADIFTEGFETQTLNNGDPLVSDAAGIITGFPNYLLTSTGTPAAFTAAKAGFFYDFNSAAGLTVAPGGAAGSGRTLKAGFTYSEGPELIANGSFDTDTTGWTLGAGWAYLNGKIEKNAAGTAAVTSTTFTPEAGKAYLVTFTVSGRTAGGVRVNLNGAQGVQRTADGTYSQVIVAGVTTAPMTFVPQNTGTRLAIDDISVKETPGSLAQMLKSPTFTNLPRNLTVSVKFAVTEAPANNDIRFGLSFPTYAANPMQSGVMFKIGQGEVGTKDKKDIEVDAHVNTAPAAVTVPFGATREDDTDYELNTWNTAEFAITTDATLEGKTRVRYNGQRLPQDIAMKALATTDGYFTVVGWANTQGTVLVDDIVISDGLPLRPEVAVLDDTTAVAPGGTVNVGSAILSAPALTKTITIKNNGTADLTTSDLAITGDFALKTGESLNATIAASTEDTIVVEMPTAAVGAKTGTLTFKNNDLNYSISLTGDVSVATAVTGWEQY